MLVWLLSIAIFLLLFVLIIFIIYFRNLLDKIYLLSYESEEIKQDFTEYYEHLKMVYEMDRYHGEPVLENLLKHSKDLNERIENFVEICYIEEPEEEEIISERKEEGN